MAIISEERASTVVYNLCTTCRLLSKSVRRFSVFRSVTCYRPVLVDSSAGCLAREEPLRTATCEQILQEMQSFTRGMLTSTKRRLQGRAVVIT